MPETGIAVIATTISGSIADWGKVGKIVPLFREMGREDVALHVADSHAEAREKTREVVSSGTRIVISAGGSGTFNAVLEGCIASGVGLESVTLGFLRKGSADLLGKVLGMPDEIEAAVRVFVESLATGRTVPCDVIRAASREGGVPPRHFAGYGGAGIFGRIPHYTENRFIKYYKGLLGQLFGDLGPFFVGAALAAIETTIRGVFRTPAEWTIRVDGREVSRGRLQALIVLNGDLGRDLPWARGEPLGTGVFHLFALRDMGAWRLPGQFRHAWDASIMDDPDRWGFESRRVGRLLEIEWAGDGEFPVNVDGSTLGCRTGARFEIVDRINLIAGPAGRSVATAESDMIA